MMYEKEKGYDQ